MEFCVREKIIFNVFIDRVAFVADEFVKDEL